MGQSCFSSATCDFDMGLHLWYVIIKINNIFRWNPIFKEMDKKEAKNMLIKKRIEKRYPYVCFISFLNIYLINRDRHISR